MRKLLYSQNAASFFKDQTGATSIEYALLGSLIAVVIAATVSALGQNLLALWNGVRNCVSYAANQGNGSCP